MEGMAKRRLEQKEVGQVEDGQHRSPKRKRLSSLEGDDEGNGQARTWAVDTNRLDADHYVEHVALLLDQNPNLADLMVGSHNGTEVFPMSRLLLAASSSHLHDILYEANEKIHDHTCLPLFLLDGDDVTTRAIVSYVLSSARAVTPRLTLECVCSVEHIARTYGLNPLVRACHDVIRSNRESALLLLSRMPPECPLKDELTQYARDHFYEIAPRSGDDGSHVQMLPRDVVVSVLSSPTLNTASEAAAYDFLLMWLQGDLAPRDTKAIEELMTSCVHMVRFVAELSVDEARSRHVDKGRVLLSDNVWCRAHFDRLELKCPWTVEKIGPCLPRLRPGVIRLVTQDFPDPTKFLEEDGNGSDRPYECRSASGSYCGQSYVLCVRCERKRPWPWSIPTLEIRLTLEGPNGEAACGEYSVEYRILNLSSPDKDCVATASLGQTVLVARGEKLVKSEHYSDGVAVFEATLMPASLE